MECGVEERVVRSMRTVAVRYFKCGEEGHKCRECPLWEKKMKRMACPVERKVHQENKRKPACLKEGKAQERKLRRVEGEEAAHPIKGKVQQEEGRSSWETLRKRTE